MPDHEAPQSRNEAILQNILGEHNELLEPQSRNEAILQAILYGDSYTEEAQSRIEKLLLCILNGTTTDLQPQSRNEEILIAKINGGTYDKEPQSRIEELLIEWLNAFVEKTVTGAVCSFDDAIAGQQFIDLSAEIVPIQASGTPSPTNPLPISGYTEGEITVCGKNLFNGTDVLNAYISTTITSSASTRTCYCRCNPNTTYTVSKTAGQRFGVAYTKELPSNGVTVYGAIASNTSASIAITTGADATYLIAYVYHGSFDSGTADAMVASVQIEVGSQATAYEAYNGQTKTVSFGQTVYGGEWKASEGKVVDVPIKVKFSDIPQANWRYSNNNGNWNSYLFFTELSMRATTGLSNIYKYQANTLEANVSNNSYILPSWNTYVYIRDDAITSVADFLQAHGDDYIILKPATPTKISVEPVNFTARNGVNNIYSNTGNSTVKYKARG